MEDIFIANDFYSNSPPGREVSLPCANLFTGAKKPAKEGHGLLVAIHNAIVCVCRRKPV